MKKCLGALSKLRLDMQNDLELSRGGAYWSALVR